MRKSSISTLPAKVMIIIFIALLAAGVLLGTVCNFGAASYVFEFVFALLAALLFLKFIKKHGERELNLHSAVLCTILALFCFVINLLCVLHYEVKPLVDFKTFYDNAVALKNWQPIDHMYLALFPHVFGFSYYLSGFMTLFGESVQAISVMNVIITTVTGIIIFFLTLRFLDKTTAAFAFILWSLCPSKMLYNCLVISEPLYTCLIFIFLLLMAAVCRIADNSKMAVPAALISGVCGAAAGAELVYINAVRPIAAILFIAFFIWLLFLRGEKEKCARHWILWGVFAAAMLICYRIGWDNWTAYEAWRLHEEPSERPAYSIYVGLDPVSKGSFSEADMDMLMNYRYDPEKGSAVYAQEQMMNEVKTLLSSGEVDPMKLFYYKLPKFLGNDEGGAFYTRSVLSRSEYVIWSAASNVFYYFCTILCLISAYRLIKKKADGLILMLPLYAVGLTLAHMIVEVSGRYKYSLIPVIVILASLTLSRKNCTGESGVYIPETASSEPSSAL